MHYRDIRRSENRTEFLYQNKNPFGRKFLHCLKFHAEGLAAVQDESGWFHINLQGKDLSTKRYDRSFGFYFDRASVIDQGKWYHLNTDGAAAYAERYAWCGNYQQSVCAVRNASDQYFHIDLYGNPCYPERHSYAGDFRDGIACVRNTDGKFQHIRLDGSFLHKATFLDLDVFHKDIARAKDESGWHHIDRNGRALYDHRFAMVEPFYNGFAIIETHSGAKKILNENGKTVLDL